MVERINGEPATIEQVEELLLRRIDFIDDETWCRRLAAHLGLRSIALDPHRRSPVATGVSVYGPSDGLHDGRLLTVARRTLEYKKVTAVAVNCGADCLMIFEPGKQARARVRGAILKSSKPIDAPKLKEIEAQGGSWADVLDVTAGVAA